jgi:hypothetical protein
MPQCTATDYHADRDDVQCPSPVVYDTPWGPLCGTHAYRAHLRSDDLHALPHEAAGEQP